MAFEEAIGEDLKESEENLIKNQREADTCNG